jgi:RNase P subunit RPR2
MSKKKNIKNEIKTFISGRSPKTCGTLCDMCGNPLQQGDNVEVHVDKQSTGEWRIYRVHCEKKCGNRLDTITADEAKERDIIAEAIVKCNLGWTNSDEYYPLHNPEMIELNTDEGSILKR